MSSEWTNKSAIMRDLLQVQGRMPIAVNSTVAAGDNPPALNIVEETEEEYYRQGLGEGDFAAPELHLIQEMLDLVRDKDIEDEDSNTAFEIAKVEPNVDSKEKRPTQPIYNARNQIKRKNADTRKQVKVNSTTKKCTKEIMKAIVGPESDQNSPKQNSPKQNSTLVLATKASNEKVRRRNVAMESIMESFKSFGFESASTSVEFNDTNYVPVKLLKPNDFKVSSSIEKVQDWFHNQDEDTSEPKIKSQNVKKNVNNIKIQKTVEAKVTPKITPLMEDFNPSSMFRRKAKTNNKTEETSKSPVAQVQSGKPQMYVPSADADEYYKKCLERCAIKQIIHEGIWMKVAEQIDEIEERRQLEAEKQKELEEAEKAALEAALEASRKETEKLLPNHESVSIDESTTDVNSKVTIEPITTQDNDVMSNGPLVDERIESELVIGPIIKELISEDKYGPIRELDNEIVGEKAGCVKEEEFDIHLPVHRHLLSENCIVCEVLCGKGTKKESNAIENWRVKSE